MSLTFHLSLSDPFHSKTTLLNILAGRLSAAGNGETSGQILVNGNRRDYRTYRKMSAYVLQMDVFYAGLQAALPCFCNITVYIELTVRETIMFSAQLRLPRAMSKEEKEARVDQVRAMSS